MDNYDFWAIRERNEHAPMTDEEDISNYKQFSTTPQLEVLISIQKVLCDISVTLATFAEMHFERLKEVRE